jgi:hypothetical protein
MATEGEQRSKLIDVTVLRLVEHLRSKGITDEDSVVVHQVVRSHLHMASELHVMVACLQVLPSELREATLKDAVDLFGCRATNEADPTLALREAIAETRKSVLGTGHHLPVSFPAGPPPPSPAIPPSVGRRLAGPPPPNPAPCLWPMETLRSTLVALQQTSHSCMGTHQDRKVERSRSPMCRHVARCSETP